MQQEQSQPQVHTCALVTEFVMGVKLTAHLARNFRQTKSVQPTILLIDFQSEDKSPCALGFTFRFSGNVYMLARRKERVQIQIP